MDGEKQTELEAAHVVELGEFGEIHNELAEGQLELGEAQEREIKAT